MTPRKATAFAPATVANVAVGFDLLGFAIERAGDLVTLTELDFPEVVIESITVAPGAQGLESHMLSRIPMDPTKNTATVGLVEMIKELGLKKGFSVKIEKGISLGSGMGGSAASAVGAVVAAASLLDRPLPKEVLLRFALFGEFVASGSSHADNAAPCLYGGLTLALGQDAEDIIRLPYPDDLICVVVHPHLELETREMRGVLKREVPLIDHVRQQGYLAEFISGCYEKDWSRISRSLIDIVIEPQRSGRITGFDDAKRAALKAGAAGFSISGSGPSVFAWAQGIECAMATKRAVQAEFKKHGLESEGWVSGISREGARAL